MIARASLAALLLAGACCTRLPELPPKRVEWQPQPRASAAEAVTESSSVWRDERRSRDVPVRIYAPAAPGRHPVVVFSHGIGEDRDSYAYLGRALASAGYLAVHVTHAGTDKAMLRRGYWHLYRATKDMQNWRNRPLDISFVLDQVLRRADADSARVAVAGHSAGAFTAFSLAGAEGAKGESFRDARVKVIIAMSMPRIEGLRYGGVTIPALNVTGTCDSSILYRTRPRDRRVPFEKASAPHQYLVTIERVNHNTFSSAGDPHHAAIVDLTLAFLRAWLGDEEPARRWFDDAGSGRVDGDNLTIEAK